MEIIKKLIKAIRKAELYALVFFVALMVVVSFSQILLRNVPDALEKILTLILKKEISIPIGAIEWFDSLLKYSVLWVGLIAAGIATYEDKHIKIDIASRFTRGPIKKLIQFFTSLFAGAVSMLLSIISYLYIVQIELTAADAPPFLDIPRWVLLLILPVGFGFMAVRFFIQALLKIITLNKPDDTDDQSIVPIE